MAQVGINTSSQSSSILGGTLASLAGNSTCIESYRRISITSAIVSLLNFQEVKLNLKFYAYGPIISCGGFLYGVTGFSFTNPTSMYKTYNSIEWQKLSTCSAGSDSFHWYTANYDLHFSYAPPTRRLIGGISLACAQPNSRHSIQINSIMVR